MASSMANALLNPLKKVNIIPVIHLQVVRNTSKLRKKKREPGTIKHRNLIASSHESLAARGFLRSKKPYVPSENVAEKIAEVCKRVLGPDYKINSALSREEKFNLLNMCFQELDYSVPNSLLHKITCARDLIDFYGTEISTTVPFDEFRNKELPPNLHIQFEYVRFNPDYDTMFKGISAFPESSTIVTGKKYKNKYQGFRAKIPEIYDNEAHFDKKDAYEWK